MNWRLAQKDFILLLRNPLTYVGILAMVMIVVTTVLPYLDLHANYRTEEEEVQYSPDADIMDGYIPTPTEERWEYVSEKMEEVLVAECGLNSEEAQAQMNKIKNSQWSVQEIRQYFIDQYGIVGFASTWDECSYKKATETEMQQYLQRIFKDETYTSYFSRKYADYIGIASILFTIVVFSILLMRDMRKNIYSFIHTKPISGFSYVAGKYVTGILLITIVVAIQTFVFDVLAVNVGKSYGFQANLLDIWKNVIAFDLPGILLTGCIMLFIAILFKNIIPAIPAMLLYFMYANIGTIDTVEGYRYQIQPGAIFVRFPQLFTETEVPQGIVGNQIFLLVLAITLFILSIQVWERRRNA